MSDGYRKQRTVFGNYGGSLLVTPFTQSQTLIPVKGPGNSADLGYTIWVQRVHIHISTGIAGGTWNIQDSNGNSITGPVSTVSTTTTVGDLASVPTQDPIQAEYDFGPEGVALSAGASLNFVCSQTGASGVVTWDAYQKLASTPPFGS